MQWLLQYAFSLVSRTERYHWGGDDPIQGFDCSGFVTELLKASGEIPHSTPKMSAQQIHDFYDHQAGSSWGAGSLAFFGKDLLHISHIGFCIDDKSMIEAGGGDSTTVTEARAIQQNAFLRMRPIKYRKDFLCVLKPFYAALGMLRI
jgi:cell wall-associated NlpC family hydrolase